MQVKDFSFVEKALSPMGEVLTFIFLTVGFLVFTVWMFRNEIKDIISKKKPNRDYKMLRYHTVFNVASNFPSKVKNIDFTTNKHYDSVKTKLLHKLLNFKSTAIHQHLNKFLDRSDIEKMPPNRLRYEFSSLLMEMIKDYNENALRYFISECGISKKDAKFLIDKYEEYRFYLVEGFTDSVESVATDEFMEDNFMRINSIFYLIGLSLDVIPNDVKRVFNDVNGRFKKYNKNEVVIPDINSDGIDWL